MNRRRFILYSSAFASNCFHPPMQVLSAQKPRLSPSDPAVSGPGDPQQISDWMKGWKTRGYQGPLVLSRFVEPMYFLYSPIKWVPTANSHDPQYATFTVPRGFVTDLASIPRVFWSVLRPDGNYAYSAILHDYLYWVQSRPREVADDILRRSMADFHVPQSTIKVIYDAVRIGGQSSWDSNHALKQGGESRFLSQFPDDPAISWTTWKTDRSHFGPNP